MKIWIDGDACPNPIKEVIFKASMRKKLQCIIVANQFIQIPPSPFIQRQIVEQGFDVADNAIVQQVAQNDLVITADIPLANDVVEKKAIAINPRGQLYTIENIKQKLAMRNFNESLRETGMQHSTHAKFSTKDIQQFSNQLDRLLAKI